MPLNSIEVETIGWVKGYAIPSDTKFRQIVVTGPPASGKSTLIQKIGGWPEEGCIDLSEDNWWQNRLLSYRPREVHFCIPFKEVRGGCTVFDRGWLASPTEINLERIQIPPLNKWFFSTDWRAQYVFDFLLPPARKIYEVRQHRAADQSHPVDKNFTLAEVEIQCSVYELLALHFHRSGLQVLIRNDFDSMPRRIIGEDDSPGKT
ncbi:MAG: serine/threonine protein phosphatase [Gammaproteobacteria bacterium]|jgi:hypothetical protein|nr:serine/threonine protein phosphatase [Gammaproteobacteria bacterium]|tara:strand:+ start:375 stop:989 length:615 start_codon:yes stop_codon:yes gene_type:complete